MTEAQRAKLCAIRRAMDALVGKIAENTAEINRYTEAIRKWTPGVYAVGDVRRHLGIPYKCRQAHDSTLNTAWTPDTTAALWTQYHGTSRETARAWVQPGGEYNMYKKGEWMIWTDGAAYECQTDTTYSPEEYAKAWQKGE